MRNLVRYGNHGLWLVLTLFVAACGQDVSPTAPNDTDPTGGNEPDDPGPPPRTVRSVDWMSEGNFWMVSWSEIDIRRAFLGQAGGDYDLGSYSMMLGSPTVVGGISMFELKLDGDVEKYTPNWSRIGADEYGDIYGLRPGSSSPQLLFSPELDSLPPNGFYRQFAVGGQVPVDRNASIIGSKYTNNEPYFEPPLAAVGSATNDVVGGGTGCEYFPGYGTICGSGPGSGAIEGEMHFEYWHPEAGPVGMHFSYDYEDCLGFACTERHTEERVEVWAFGDVSNGDRAHNLEPDGLSEPTSLPVGWSYFSMIGEVYQSEAATGSGEWTAHDWYIVDVSERSNIGFTLIWSQDDQNFDLDLYTAPGSVWGFQYLDSAVTVDLPPAKYAKLLGVDINPGQFVIGVTLTTPSEFGVGYGLLTKLFPLGGNLGIRWSGPYRANPLIDVTLPSTGFPFQP